jgi:chromosome segregation ATPase
MAQYGKAACAMCAAATEEHGLTLGKTYAVARHAEASESAVELKKTIAELDRVMREKKVAGKEAVEAATRKIEAARKKAKELEKEDATELRSPEGDALWDSMPHDLGQLEAEIEGLEEEIEAGGDDSGNTLAAYTRRLSAIEAQQKKVDATEEEIGAMSGRLATMTAAWKPELERMIGGVDKEFASYFSRFGCRGEVALSDGRETPQSADDFAKYKVHIRVAWRDEEELHVLGEGGRDSGGERSVATMIYLISLQGINPAPFRVVDEINQAMDSTNERFVFECITHACRSGGKQYFLLTPKLLPDLDYGEETVLQLVMNGPYNLKREALSLDRFC